MGLTLGGFAATGPCDCCRGTYLYVQPCPGPGTTVRVQGPDTTDITHKLGPTERVYTVTDPAAGTWTITVSRDCFVTQVITATVETGKTTDVHVYLDLTFNCVTYADDYGNCSAVLTRTAYCLEDTWTGECAYQYTTDHHTGCAYYACGTYGGCAIIDQTVPADVKVKVTLTAEPDGTLTATFERWVPTHTGVSLADCETRRVQPSLWGLICHFDFNGDFPAQWGYPFTSEGTLDCGTLQVLGGTFTDTTDLCGNPLVDCSELFPTFDAFFDTTCGLACFRTTVCSPFVTQLYVFDSTDGTCSGNLVGSKSPMYGLACFPLDAGTYDVKLRVYDPNENTWCESCTTISYAGGGDIIDIPHGPPPSLKVKLGPVTDCKGRLVTGARVAVLYGSPTPVEKASASTTAGYAEVYVTDICDFNGINPTVIVYPPNGWHCYTTPFGVPNDWLSFTACNEVTADGAIELALSTACCCDCCRYAGPKVLDFSDNKGDCVLDTACTTGATCSYSYSCGTCIEGIVEDPMGGYRAIRSSGTVTIDVELATNLTTSGACSYTITRSANAAIWQDDAGVKHIDLVCDGAPGPFPAGTGRRIIWSKELTRTCNIEATEYFDTNFSGPTSTAAFDVFDDLCNIGEHFFLSGSV